MKLGVPADAVTETERGLLSLTVMRRETLDVNEEVRSGESDVEVLPDNALLAECEIDSDRVVELLPTSDDDKLREQHDLEGLGRDAEIAKESVIDAESDPLAVGVEITVTVFVIHRVVESEISLGDAVLLLVASRL